MTSHASRFFLVSGEAVDEELVLAARAHGVEEKVHRDFTGNDLTLLDHLRYHVAVRAAGLHVRAKQVARAEMRKAEILTMLAHCVPLPAPGPPRTNTTAAGLTLPPAEAVEGAAGASAAAPSAQSAVAVGAKAAATAVAANPKAREGTREAAASAAARRCATRNSAAAAGAHAPATSADHGLRCRRSAGWWGGHGVGQLGCAALDRARARSRSRGNLRSENAGDRDGSGRPDAIAHLHSLACDAAHHLTSEHDVGDSTGRYAR